MIQEKKRMSGRVVYITAVLILALLAAVVVFTSQNRKNTTEPPVTEPSGTTDPHETTLRPETTPAPETDPPETPPVTDPPAAAEPADAPPESFVAPAHGSLSKGHDTETLVYSLTMNDYRTHTGIDIVSTVGAPVFAAAGGTVGEIWEDPMMGYCMSIKHSGGMVTVYKNLSPELPAGITAGVPVSEGEIIAAIGETALIESADESHLHFEVKLNGDFVNPTDYLAQLTSVEYGDE